MDEKASLSSFHQVSLKRKSAFILLILLAIIISYTLENNSSVVSIFFDVLVIQIGFSALDFFAYRKTLYPWQKVLFFTILVYTTYFLIASLRVPTSNFRMNQLRWFLPGLVLLFSVVLMSPSRKETRILLLSFLLVGGVISSILGILRYLRQGRAYGLLFMNPNFFGAYLLAIAPVAVAWLFAARGKWGRALAVVSSLIIIAALFFTLCRGSILALFVAVFFMSWWLRSYWLFPSLLGYYAFCSLIAPRVYNRFFPLLTGTLDMSSIDRLQLWRAALKLWETKPLFGVGIGGYRLFAPDFGLPSTVLVENRYAFNCHNSFLEILADQGIVGLAAFLGLLAVFFFPVLRRLFCRRPANPWLAGMAGGVLGFLGQNMTNSLFLYNSISWAAWLLLGLAVCWVHNGAEGGEPACAS